MLTTEIEYIYVILALKSCIEILLNTNNFNGNNEYFLNFPVILKWHDIIR